MVFFSPLPSGVVLSLKAEPLRILENEVFDPLYSATKFIKVNDSDTM